MSTNKRRVNLSQTSQPIQLMSLFNRLLSMNPSLSFSQLSQAPSLTSQDGDDDMNIGLNSDAGSQASGTTSPSMPLEATADPTPTPVPVGVAGVEVPAIVGTVGETATEMPVESFATGT